MPNEIIFAKLEQIENLLRELEQILSVPFDRFSSSTITVHAAERTFQLIVDISIDINTQLLLEHSKKTPDTYRQSFIELEHIGVISPDLAGTLAASASLRNILVHEYDFEDDYRKFYESAKGFIAPYHLYTSSVHTFVKK